MISLETAIQSLPEPDGCDRSVGIIATSRSFGWNCCDFQVEVGHGVASFVAGV